MLNITNLREMQIKTTMRYHLTLVRVVIIKKKKKEQEIINAGKHVKKRKSLCIVNRNVKLVHPLWKLVWKFLKKLKIELPYDLAIPLLHIYPK